MFTTNRVAAAPVDVGRAALVSTGGRVRAVVVNSGNANCATGRAGIQACERVCREAGNLLGVSAAEIFPSSTGIIGVRLPAEKILKKLPELVILAALLREPVERPRLRPRHHDSADFLNQTNSVNYFAAAGSTRDRFTPGVQFLIHPNIKASFEYQFRPQQVTYNSSGQASSPFRTNTATGALEFVY